MKIETIKNKKIKLFWYKHYEGSGNFGDELSPYIVSEISGCKVEYINIDYFNFSSFNFVKNISSSLINKRISFKAYLKHIYYYYIGSYPSTLVSIGSILHYVGTEGHIVWGAGIIEKTEFFRNSDFRAVRGKRTQERIRELGYSIPKFIGDPALLMPLIYTSKNTRMYKVGIIPHHIHFDELKKFNTNDIKVINLLDPIEKVVDDINSCEITLSTSLHGIIVSHAYGIPSVWFANDSNKLVGDDIKFDDYFSSVNIKTYKPLSIRLVSKCLDDNLSLIKDLDEKCVLPCRDQLYKIQQNLLDSFPFPLIEKYRINI